MLCLKRLEGKSPPAPLQYWRNMKQLIYYFMKISSNFLKIVLIALIFASVPFHAWGAGAAHVDYDPTTGKLTVKAEDAGLAWALALVSHKTGVWIRIDPSIEKSITIELTNTPLESALRRLARGLNHAMFYESSQGDGPRLVGMSVLSGGDAFGAGARSSGRSVTRTYTGNPGGFSSSGYSTGGDGSISPGAGMPGSAAMDVVHMDDEGPQDMTVEQPADVAEGGIVLPAGEAHTANDAGTPSTASPRGVYGSYETSSDRMYPTPGSH